MIAKMKLKGSLCAEKQVAISRPKKGEKLNSHLTYMHYLISGRTDCVLH